MCLPVAERRAVMNAVAKLEVFGDHLGAPHTSQVIGSPARLGIAAPGSGVKRLPVRTPLLPEVLDDLARLLMADLDQFRVPGRRAPTRRSREYVPS